MNRQQKGWTAAFLSGAAGWYLALESAKVVPSVGPWWVGILAGLAAVVAWFYSTPVVFQDMDRLAKKLAATEHCTRYDLLVKREERLAKWLMVPLIIWWLPVIFAFVGGMANYGE